MAREVGRQIGRLAEACHNGSNYTHDAQHIDRSHTRAQGKHPESLKELTGKPLHLIAGVKSSSTISIVAIIKTGPTH